MSKEIGKVKWFNNKKGFGFIERASGGDVFVHYSAIEMEGYRKLDEGAEVEFELKDGPKGLQAFEVVRVEPQPNGTAPGQPPLSRELAPETTDGSAETMSASAGA